MAYAQLDPVDLKLLQGDNEVQFEGIVRFDTAQETDLDFSLRRGWFVKDGLLFGFLGSFRYNDDVTRYGLGLYSDLHFDRGYYFVPFIGIAATYQDSDRSDLGSGNYVVADVYGGVKYFITDGLAWSARAVLQYATDDVFETSSGEEAYRVSLRFGMHYHY